MKNLPNFLIIGPPKCASTSLYHYLAQHPEVYMSPIKETNFFTHDFHKGLNFYSDYFADAGAAKAIGEATPSYFFLPFAAERIKGCLPEVKLIITFRNPAERAFSHWLMFKEAGLEKSSFREALNINLRQMNYLDFKGEKGAAIWDDRKQNTSSNENWLRIYIQPGMYAENLNMLYQKFSKEQIHIIFLEDLKNNFQKTMGDLFAFIEVDKEFEISNTSFKNFYFDKKYFRLLQKIIGTKQARYLSDKMPGNIKNLFRQKQNSVKAIPRISEEDRVFLNNLFAADVRQLEKITRRNLEHWVNAKITSTVFN